MTTSIQTTPISRVWPRQSHLKRRAQLLLSGMAGFAAIALTFEIIARMELVNPKLFPPASVVLPRAVELLVEPAFLTEVGATLTATLLGVGIGFVIAVPAGLLIGSYSAVSLGATPIIDFLRSVPGIAIIPLLVLTLGQGLSMKVAIVLYVAVWPMLFNTVYGVRGVDRVALETARSFRMGTVKTWFRVVLPSALPLILTGLRLALSTGLTVAIAAEITVGTNDGVGYYILLASYSGLNHDTVFAAVILAGVLGFGLNWLTTRLSDRFIAWDTRGGAAS
ncbi:NitT/TauT family transport system permease protein [Arthrobacter sp. V4I6]|uniref:ABC transporter permease n=1 Tax=unclassified Arthrobacter TaxID=235627 RepID=UPI0027889B3F|nr:MULTISPECIES: ABC transporter permease [unclassified Arthrobacter]MDQ0821595.1 NitT/TauT family transport system permease protein [Arthrobacter sp. V1I7]MDQ0855860.1 NitT/TauT family transport system permease protein [Arthrobacter sp. V4I6]